MFITFEGCEGCGKSTQARLLHSNLRSRGIPVVLTREPGGTPLGSSVRNLLKSRQDFDISPETELMLFNACRAQLVKDIIRPALDTGKTVVCDRFSDSTIVYQGYGRGLNLSQIEYVNMVATGGIKPDITILLDEDPKLGLERKHDLEADRFDNESLSFHRKVREGYLLEASKDPERWTVIQAQQPIESISKDILGIVLSRLGKVVEDDR